MQGGHALGNYRNNMYFNFLKKLNWYLTRPWLAYKIIQLETKGAFYNSRQQEKNGICTYPKQFPLQWSNSHTHATCGYKTISSYLKLDTAKVI